MSENPQSSKEEQNWAMFCHLAALSGFIIPLGNILGPLILWLIKKDTMPLVDQHGKEALNFQITVLFAFIISAVLTLVLIGFLLMFVASARSSSPSWPRSRSRTGSSTTATPLPFA
jgi:uncharacterized Tic20 family protein